MAGQAISPGVEFINALTVAGKSATDERPKPTDNLPFWDGVMSGGFNALYPVLTGLSSEAQSGGRVLP